MSGNDSTFTEEQQQYLAGFLAGSGIASSVAGVVPPSSEAPGVEGDASSAAEADYDLPEQLHLEAQDRVVAEGGKLVKEEKAKRQKQQKKAVGVTKQAASLICQEMADMPKLDKSAKAATTADVVGVSPRKVEQVRTVMDRGVLWVLFRIS